MYNKTAYRIEWLYWLAQKCKQKPDWLVMAKYALKHVNGNKMMEMMVAFNTFYFRLINWGI